MGFCYIMKCAMLSFASATTIETIEANIKPRWIVLRQGVSLAQELLSCETYYGIEALGTILTINRLGRSRRA